MGRPYGQNGRNKMTTFIQICGQINCISTKMIRKYDRHSYRNCELRIRSLHRSDVWTYDLVSTVNTLKSD